jgi:hypothetical protein
MSIVRVSTAALLEALYFFVEKSTSFLASIVLFIKGFEKEWSRAPEAPDESPRCPFRTLVLFGCVTFGG